MDEAQAFDPEIAGTVDQTPTIRQQDLPAPFRSKDAGPNASWMQPAGWMPDVTDAFDRDRVSAAMRRRLGPRYGGEWVEGQGDSAAYVYGAVNATVADRSAARELAGTDRVRVVNVKYSVVELAAYAHRVEALLRRNRIGDALLGVHEPVNAVRLQTAAVPPKFRAAVAEVVPDDALMIVEQSMPSEGHSTPDAWRGADGRAYYEGSLRIYVVNPSASNWSGCQTAFYVWNNSFGPFGMTAGHCSRAGNGGGATGQPVRSPDGVFTGTTGINTFGAPGTDTNADALVFSTASAVNNPRIFCVVAMSCHWGVMGVFARNYPRVNEQICRNSIELTRADCAPVTIANAFVLLQGTGKRVRSWCAAVATAPGDSGGPWYRYYTNGTVRAAGVNWSGDANQSCYSHIYYATTGTSTFVVTQ